jgi:arsenic resistance protein ArsH
MMKLLIFNGEPGDFTGRSSAKIADYISGIAQAKGFETEVLNVGELGVPFFDFSHKETPAAVLKMVESFTSATHHIWLTPLYHGNMTGMMKNALDWLEVTSCNQPAYLTNKYIGMICWADGGYALHGITAMENVAKSLRAWVIPFSIPVMQRLLINEDGTLNTIYSQKMELLVSMLMNAPVTQPVLQA